MALEKISANVLLDDGSATAPSLTFLSPGGQGNGLFHKSAGVMGIAIQGSEVGSWSSKGLASKGTTTNDSATAGNVGEIITANVLTSTNVGGASSEYWDASSLALTAGDWDLTGHIVWYANGATFTSTYFQTGMGSVTGNSGSGMDAANSVVDSGAVPTTFATFSQVMPTVRVSLSTAATRYLKGYFTTTTAGTPQYRCSFRARRVR
jgi:hypothetical protein